MITLYFRTLFELDAVETILQRKTYKNVNIIEKHYTNNGTYSITFEGHEDWQLFTLGQAHQIIIINDNTRSTNTSI
jgi:hypothetical protein